ncbi:MAG: hypothetical protein COB67_00145 [SAR324 cluster bacterium]|uniref:Lipoprotein n=1 Tax=SAR324 cluster bacterium TaxID=2024889 RepID=A0A2A4TC58_9DELT|nr:MAG: hypothetical protein COB67_00145 [SAR324 cluster bacterium]
MKTKIIKTTLTVLLAIVATGCASRDYRISVEEIENIQIPSLKEEKVLHAATANAFRTNATDIFIGDSEESFWLLFQTISDKTLKSGNNYFAIYKPRYLSNIDGVQLHTMDKVKSLCVDKQSRSMIDKLVVFDWGSLNELYCNSINSNSGFAEFVMFKNKPEGLEVYDAKKVLTYLDDSGNFADELTYEEDGSDVTRSDKVSVYSQWYEEQRDFWPNEGDNIPFPDNK